MFISSIISQSLFISSGCNFAEKFRTKRDAVFCDGPTSIYLQKPASIQPRTSLSKFGGKFNPFFIRHLAGKRTERRLRGALERGPRLGGCRDQVGRSVGQCQKIQIAKNRPRYSRERSRLNFPPRATSGQISQVSFFALPAQEHNFVASKRTQSSAK